MGLCRTLIGSLVKVRGQIYWFDQNFLSSQSVLHSNIVSCTSLKQCRKTILQIAKPEQTPVTISSEEMGDSVLLETLTKQLDEIKATLKEKVQLFMCSSDICFKS